MDEQAARRDKAKRAGTSASGNKAFFDAFVRSGMGMPAPDADAAAHGDAPDSSSAWPFFIRFSAPSAGAMDGLCAVVRRRPPPVVRLWAGGLQGGGIGYAEFRCACEKSPHDCIDVLIYKLVDAQIVHPSRLALYEKTDPATIANCPSPSALGGMRAGVRVTYRKNGRWP